MSCGAFVDRTLKRLYRADRDHDRLEKERMETTYCTYDWSLDGEAQNGNQGAITQSVHAHDESVSRLALRITCSLSEAQNTTLRMELPS
jgi:hypothetical protein